MRELVRTNDLVLLSFIRALLDDAGVEYLLLDSHMSTVEGSLGVLPRRVLVPDDQLARARRVLTDAGIAGELRE
jgi:hypothetical protein